MNVPRLSKAPSAAARTSATLRLAEASSDDDIRKCFAVMRQLRPHLPNAATFLSQVRRQEQQGYRLLVLWSGTQPIACAGYRLAENLARGRFLYVDDLVTQEDGRSRGHGRQLLHCLVATAKQAGAGALVLDAALGNARGHRFYFREGLAIAGVHFAVPVRM